MHARTGVTTVGERGQTSIPAHVRKRMRLQPGSRLVWEQKGDDEVLITVLPRSKPNPIAMLGFAKRFRRTRRTGDWMAELRSGEK